MCVRVRAISHTCFQPSRSELKKLPLLLNTICIDLNVVHINGFHTSILVPAESGKQQRHHYLSLCLSCGVMFKELPY